MQGPCSCRCDFDTVKQWIVEHVLELKKVCFLGRTTRSGVSEEEAVMDQWPVQLNLIQRYSSQKTES